MPTPWWSTAFGPHYTDVYAHRDDGAAAAEVAGLLPRLRAAPGPVLDACCGSGRHLAALRAAGIQAFGFDYSPPLLTTAAKRPHCAGRLVRSDMRAPALSGGWGAVLLLFTAFGYFDDAQNAASLTTLGQLLAPGGWLVLDLPEPEALIAGLVPSSVRHTPAGLDVSECRRVVEGRIEKTVELSRAGVVIEHYVESVRLYRRDEVVTLATAVGLNVMDVWTGMRGSGIDDGRLMFWLRR